MSHHLLAHVASWACHRWAVATGFWLLGVLKVQRSKQKFEQREPLEFEVLTSDRLSVWHVLLWTIKSAKRFPNNADKHFQQHLGAPQAKTQSALGVRKHQHVHHLAWHTFHCCHCCCYDYCYYCHCYCLLLLHLWLFVVVFMIIINIITIIIIFIVIVMAMITHSIATTLVPLSCKAAAHSVDLLAIWVVIDYPV